MPEIKWFNQISTYTPPEDEGIVASISDVAPLVTLYEGDEYCGMEVFEDRFSGKDVKNLKAKKFVELIMQGKNLGKAAKEVNESLASLQNREETQMAIRKIVEDWTFNPEIRTMLSRALPVKIAVEQSLNSDPKAAKVVLEAIKLIASDEQVGWLNPKTPPQGSGNAQLPEALQKLLGGGSEKEEVVDGEVSGE